VPGEGPAGEPRLQIGSYQATPVHGFTRGNDGAEQPVAISEFTSWCVLVVGAGVFLRGADAVARDFFGSRSNEKPSASARHVRAR